MWSQVNSFQTCHKSFMWWAYVLSHLKFFIFPSFWSIQGFHITIPTVQLQPQEECPISINPIVLHKILHYKPVIWIHYLNLAVEGSDDSGSLSSSMFLLLIVKTPLKSPALKSPFASIYMVVDLWFALTFLEDPSTGIVNTYISWEFLY